MKYRVILHKKVLKFINSLKNSDKIKIELKKLEYFSIDKRLDLNIKSLKGNWRRYYRVRFGNLRFIFKIIDNSIIFVEKGGKRGNVYD